MINNESVQSYVSELLSEDISYPCNPGMTTSDLVKGVLSDAIASGNCSVQKFEAALEGLDRIIEDSTLLKCPLIECIYNKLVEYNDQYTCSTLGVIFDSESFTLRLFAGNTDQGDDLIYSDETAEYIKDKNEVYVYINYNCVKDTEEIRISNDDIA